MQSNEKISHISIIRLILAALIGIIFGAYIYNTIDRGVYYYFAIEHSTPWNKIFWNDWLLRIIGLIISSGVGSIVAGLIARKKGKIIGLISVIPSILFWFYCIYCLQNNQLNLNISVDNLMPASTPIFMLYVAALLNLIVGYIGGLYGEQLRSNFNFNFESRKFSLLGIKWYHFFWYPFVMYFILIEGFYIFSYGYEKVKILFSLPRYSLSTILINLRSFPALLGLGLIYLSINGSYQIITDNSKFVETTKGKVILMSLLIIVAPLIALGLTDLSFYLELVFH